MTPFNLLPYLCIPYANRVSIIKTALLMEGIHSTEDWFLPEPGVPDWTEGKKGYSTNVVVDFPGVDPSKTTIFLAHHDVKRPELQNCQDNTASVVNLIDLCFRLHKTPPPHRVVVVFTDTEEDTNPVTCGSRRLAEQILRGTYGNVIGTVNLELTASGTQYWATKDIGEPFQVVSTPYSDTLVLEMAGVKSVCVGSLTPENLNEAKAIGFCETWALCHSEKDTFDKAVEADMSRFVDLLVSHLLTKEEFPDILPGNGRFDAKQPH